MQPRAISRGKTQVKAGSASLSAFRSTRVLHLAWIMWHATLIFFFSTRCLRRRRWHRFRAPYQHLSPILCTVEARFKYNVMTIKCSLTLSSWNFWFAKTIGWYNLLPAFRLRSQIVFNFYLCITPQRIEIFCPKVCIRWVFLIYLQVWANFLFNCSVHMSVRSGMFCKELLQ